MLGGDGRLKKLCETNGVSGYENNIAEYIKSFIENKCHGNVKVDSVGNVNFHGISNCEESKILFIAHMDEVGFQIIKSIGENKFTFKTLGNIKMWNANQQLVIFDNGEYGIIYSSNESNIHAHNYDNMYVEVLNKNTSINVGDVFTFYSKYIESEDSVYGKAIDNRVGCYCLLRVLENKNSFKHDTYVSFTTQEEVSMRGARVVTSTIAPNNVDVSPIGNNNSLKIGNGVGVKVSDSIGISDKFLVQRIIEIADLHDIKYQIEVSDCGTSELIISNEIDMGSRNIGLSIPCEHMHTSHTKIYKKDVEACIKLLEHILNEL